MRPLILLFGAGGRLGQAIAAHPNFAGWALRGFSRIDCDAADPTAVDAVLAQAARTHDRLAVVNAAAFTDVGLAEKLRRTHDGRARVLRSNVEAPKVLSQAALRHSAVFLHISTDYVFSGGGLKAHRPDSRANPEGFYGRTKYLGERAVARTFAGSALPWAVLRIGWLHGAPGDFVEKVLDAALGRRLSYMRSNQWGTPTSYEAAAAACAALLTGLFEPGAAPLGMCHYAESGPYVNRYRLTQKILSLASEEAARRAQAATDPNRRKELDKVSACFSSCALRLKGARIHDPARPSNCRLLCGQVFLEKLSTCYSWMSSVNNSVDNFLDRRGF